MALSLLFWMALMVASQVVSWTYVIQASSAAATGTTNTTSNRLYTAVWQLSLFYMAWALYKKIFLHDANELGHISFGLLAVTTFLKWKWPALIANVILVANFLLAVTIIFSFSPSGLAHLIKDDTTALGVVWAYTFSGYIFSSLGLWSYVLYQLWRLPSPTLSSSPYTSLPTATTY